MLGVVDAVLARASVMTGYAGIFSCDGWDLLLFLWAWKWFLLLGRVAFLRASCDFRQVIPSTKCRTLRGATLSTLHWATGAALWIPGRRCRPALGSKTESHAFDGMAFCFAGARGCVWVCKIRCGTGTFWAYGARAHHGASTAEAVQRAVEIVVVRRVRLNR